MKKLIILLMFSFTIVACKDANKELYNRVMDVHDEVMPKMEDIYRLKKDLQDNISSSPDMVSERKQELERVISNLDSASNAMMDWMHKFSPLADTVDRQQAKEYLESEMERIKEVKEQMVKAIELAKNELAKN